MMDEIAAMSMDMSAAKLAANYSTSLTAKVMDTTEDLALKEISDMLPQTTPMGTYIDTYA
jgi:hypothetical protein